MGLDFPDSQYFHNKKSAIATTLFTCFVAMSRADSDCTTGECQHTDVAGLLQVTANRTLPGSDVLDCDCARDMLGLKVLCPLTHECCGEVR